MRGFSSSVKEILLSKDKLKSEHNKYLSMQSDSLYRLYEKGLLSKVEYDEVELKSSLLDLLGDDSIYICSNMTGEVILTKDMLTYCMHILADKPYIDDLKAVYDYIVANNNVYDLAEAYRVGTRFDFKVNPVISFSRIAVVYRCKINFDNPVIIGCIEIEEGYKLQRLDMRMVIYRLLCEEVKIPSKTFSNAVKTNKGVFIKGMSLKQELGLLHSLLEGELCIDFVNGKCLESAIINYYNNKVDDTDTTFRSYILDKSFDTRNNLFNASISKLSDYKPVCSSLDFMYIAQKGVVAKRKVSSAVQMGMFVIDNLGRELSCVNLFNGYSGEFVSSEYCFANNLKPVGVPTRLKRISVNNTSQLVVQDVDYYNISQVKDFNGNPIKSCLGVSYKPFPYTLDYILSKLKTSKEELASVLYLRIQPKLTTSVVTVPRYKGLIADYAYMLISAKCGVSDSYQDTLYRETYSIELLTQVMYEAGEFINELISTL